jgi:hypothetical protein
VRSQDFYIQEDVRPSRSPDGHSSRQHLSFGTTFLRQVETSFQTALLYFSGATSRGEATSSSSTSAVKNAGLIDDLTHRTPHFGYTSDIAEQAGTVPVHTTKIKEKASDFQFKHVGRNLPTKDSHDPAFREKVFKSRPEAVRRYNKQTSNHCSSLAAAGAVAQSARFVC